MAAKDPSTKRIKRVSSDNIVLSFDLLSNLTYMGVLAAAQLPRDAIIRTAGEMRGKVTRKKVRSRVSPSTRDVSSSAGSIDLRALDVNRKGKGAKYKPVTQMMPAIE